MKKTLKQAQIPSGATMGTIISINLALLFCLNSHTASETQEKEKIVFSSEPQEYVPLDVQEAIWNDNTAVVEAFLSANPKNINAKVGGMFPMSLLAFAGLYASKAPKTIKLLLQRGAAAHSSLLYHLADQYVTNYDPEIIPMAIKAGADVNYFNEAARKYVLGRAIESKNLDVKTLLENGANPDLLSWSQVSIVKHVYGQEYLDSIKELIASFRKESKFIE